MFPHKDLSPELFKDFIDDVIEEPRIEPIAEEGMVGGGEKDIDDEFLDQIREFFQEKTGSPFADESYKGFLEINNNIFAIIDGSPDQHPTVENFLWVTVDEIINKKTITIDPLVIQLFTDNKLLSRINNETSMVQILYLCKKEGDVYKNVYYEQGENAHNTVTIINEKVLHPILKQIYLFSETPLPSELPIGTIKRFALFTDPQNKIQGELDSKGFWSKGFGSKSPVFGFEENDVHFWATKSPKYFTEI